MKTALVIEMNRHCPLSSCYGLHHYNKKKKKKKLRQIIDSATQSTVGKKDYNRMNLVLCLGMYGTQA